MSWSPESLPDLTGRSYVITGGNSGLGLEAAKILARKGAKVVFTARSEAKATAAAEEIRAAAPDADVDFVLLDLTDPDSIESAATALLEACPDMHGIINNAGVMQTPLIRTNEGFELQLATNHLGHFRLNSRLFDRLEASAGRVVAVSSFAHRMGRIRFDDLMSEKSYDPTTAYSQSKLANLLFAFELDRRLQARGSTVTAYGCHPGYAATNLQSAGVGMQGGSSLLRNVYRVTNKLLAQSAEKGAYPLVLAVADPSAERGAYYGPTQFSDTRGRVGKSKIGAAAKDEGAARRLWEVTEELVGPFFRD